MFHSPLFLYHSSNGFCDVSFILSYVRLFSKLALLLRLNDACDDQSRNACRPGLYRLQFSRPDGM